MFTETSLLFQTNCFFIRLTNCINNTWLFSFEEPQLLLENMLDGTERVFYVFHRIYIWIWWILRILCILWILWIELGFVCFPAEYFHILNVEFSTLEMAKHGNWKMTWRWNIRSVEWVEWAFDEVFGMFGLMVVGFELRFIGHFFSCVWGCFYGFSP